MKRTLCSILLSTLIMWGCDDTGGEKTPEDTQVEQDSKPAGDTSGDPDTTLGDVSNEDTAESDTGSGDATVEQDTNPADTGSADTGSADTGSADTGSADTGTADTGSEDTTQDTTTPVEDPADWSQCTTNQECRDKLGWDPAFCNTDWPGGRCSCNGNATDACFELGNGANTPVCAGDLGAGFFCTYESLPGTQDCPVWLRERFFVGDDYCLLKTCSDDSDCGPFVCRSLGGGGGTTYCQAPE